MVESRRRMREKGRQRERANERASERAGWNEGGKERRERDVTGEWTTGSRTQSNTAHKPKGYLTYCTPSPQNSPQLRNIISLQPLSSPRSANPATNPSIHYSERVEVELCELTIGNLADELTWIDWISRDVKWVIFIYIELRRMKIFRRKVRVTLKIISKVFLVSI